MRKFVSAFLAVLILLGCANVFVLAADEGLALQASTDTDIPAPAPEPTKEEVLLTEIRDLLRDQNGKAAK